MFRKATVTPFAVIAVTLLVLISPFTPAHAQAQKSRCWAVFVAVDDYQHIKDLKASISNARGLYELLRPVLDDTQVKSLYDSEATYAGVQVAINWLAANDGENDTVLFYFSGHGDKEYIAPYDALYENTYVSSASLKDWLAKIKSKKVAIILDTCYADSFNNEISGAGRVILFSARGDELTWETSRFPTGWRAIFTYYLTEALSKFGTADTNDDYELSAEELFRYAESKTLSLTNDLYNGGTIKNVQHPVLSDQYPGELGLLVKFIFKIDSSLPMGSDVIILDNKKYTNKTLSPPVELIWAPGTTHELTIISPLTAGGRRYVFSSWENGEASLSRKITRGGLYWATYKLQYELLLESAYGIPQGAGWYNAGTNATISVPSLIEEPGTRRIFLRWSGLNAQEATASVVMDAPKQVKALWRTDYLLTVTSEYGKPEGAGWYESGFPATLSVAPVEGVLIRHIFTGWSGDFTSLTPTATLVITKPMTVTANWRTDYVQLYLLIGGIAVLVTATIIVLRTVKRRKSQSVVG